MEVIGTAPLGDKLDPINSRSQCLHLYVLGGHGFHTSSQFAFAMYLSECTSDAHVHGVIARVTVIWE